MAATGPFDIVDVFRRAEDCPEHAREAVAAGARVLWLQLGIVSWEAARIAHDGGLGVVMDRCLSVELAGACAARDVAAGRPISRRARMKPDDDEGDADDGDRGPGPRLAAAARPSRPTAPGLPAVRGGPPRQAR